MKILITGGSGLLGQYLNIELSGSNEILSLYNKNIGNCGSFQSARVDITNYSSLKNIMREFNPDAVIHTAAVSKANLADQLPSKIVYEINVNAVKRLAQLCEQYNAKLIYISTDLVYGGYRGSNLDENSKLVPISLYAETKLMGEVKIKETFDNYIILRMALLYGFGLSQASCHFHQMYDNLKNGNEVNLFYDQFRSPLALPDAARMMNELLGKNIKGETFNFGGNERLSRCELGKVLCNIAGFDKKLINAVSMEEIDFKYKVADVSMNIDKLKSAGITLKSVEESIRIMVKNKSI